MDFFFFSNGPIDLIVDMKLSIITFWGYTRSNVIEHEKA